MKATHGKKKEEEKKAKIESEIKRKSMLDIHKCERLSLSYYWPLTKTKANFVIVASVLIIFPFRFPFFYCSHTGTSASTAPETKFSFFIYFHGKWKKERTQQKNRKHKFSFRSFFLIRKKCFVFFECYKITVLPVPKYQIVLFTQTHRHTFLSFYFPLYLLVGVNSDDRDKEWKKERVFE